MAPLLYENPLSPGVRAVLMTEKALNIKQEKKYIDFAKGDHLKAELTSINPQHTIPTLVDGDAVIWDSHAINAYLVRKYGKDDKLYPKDFVKRAIVDQRLHFDSGSLFSILYRMVKPMWMGTCYKLSQDLIAETHQAYTFLNTFLDGKEWVAGEEVTIADFSLLGTATSLDILVPIDAEKYPNIDAWIKRAKMCSFYEGNQGVEDYRNVLQDFLSRG